MTGQHWTPADIGDLTGQTALVTGGNSGIGLETARVLAGHGMRVILAGRSPARLDDAAQALRSRQPGATVDTAVIDLGSLASIKAAADALAPAQTLDLLVNNAGVMNVPQRQVTADGFELTFGTNHLGHVALTAQLMPALRRARAARIVTVSAIAARWPIGRLTDPMSEQRYRPMTAYAKSKRANMVFTIELARRLRQAGSPIEAVAVHPGAAMTGLQRHTEGHQILTALAAKILMGSPRGAAWPSLSAATSPAVTSGTFLGPAGRRQDSGTPRPARLPRGASDPAQGSQLWRASEEWTGVPVKI